MSTLHDYALGIPSATAAGAALAWWMRRYTTLSIRNVYLGVVALLALTILAVKGAHWKAFVFLVWPAVALVMASVAGRRMRLSDLGAGDDLRRHEMARRWIWQSAPATHEDERVYIAAQGEIVRERSWPANEPYVPLTADKDVARAPRRSGLHVAAVGATGSGKTTTVLRVAVGRALADRAALLLIDQKGDPLTEKVLRQLASATGRPFILFDPYADDTDHWQPLWGQHPSDVVARALAGIRTTEPYYADTLRQHVTLIASVLHAAGYWPPSFPLLVRASQLYAYDRIAAAATQLRGEHPDLWRRVENHTEWVTSREGQQALRGGLVRLDLTVARHGDRSSSRAP